MEHQDSNQRQTNQSRVEPSRPITNQVLIGAFALVTLVTAGLMWWLLSIASSATAPIGAPDPRPALQIDAVRTALTAGAGTGGGLALMLAFRRQRKVEEASIISYQAALAVELDAEERRITELYMKATEQLGSESIAIRLAGLYALDRLGEVAPRQRKVISAVYCALIRMPHDADLQSENQGNDAISRREYEEREVRDITQRLLTSHFKRSADSSYWPEVDSIDLTGAVLLNFPISDCILPELICDRSVFVGDATFTDCEFNSFAIFDDAKFEGNALFNNSRFCKRASFWRTEFEDVSGFRDVQFKTDEVLFESAVFHNSAWFVGARFNSKASLFHGTQFRGPVDFSRSSFHAAPEFTEASAKPSRRTVLPAGWAFGAPQPDGLVALEVAK